VTLRPVGADDIDGLVGLHHGLTLDEMYHRSFSTRRPDRAYLEKVATVGERGGHGLVATIAESRWDPPRPIGVAAYELLGNGDGELALVVAPEWRAWLAPLLLQAILGAAAERDVPNLESDVLNRNQPMLALMRSQGCAFMPGTEPWSVRVVVGTSGRTPTWPGPHDRPRVLVESPAGSWHAAADAAGWQLLACRGPGERSCPALAGQPCSLAAAADAVVVVPVAGDDRWDALILAHRERHPGVALCTDSGGPTVGGAAHALALAGPVHTGQAVVAEVDSVARAHARRADGWLGDAPEEAT
jgi:hypothetical protein